LWRPAVRIWRDHFWFGAGPAHFEYRSRQYRPIQEQSPSERAHNDFLNALADWGVVGAAMIAAAWGLLFAGVRKTWSYVRGSPRDLGGAQTSNKFAFVLGATLGLIAILCHSAVDFNMYIPANALLAVALMALLSSHLRFATDRYWFTPRMWTRLRGTLVLGAGMAYLGLQSLRHTVENVWLARAAGAGNFSLAKAAILQKAFKAEPMNAATACAIADCLRLQSAGAAPADKDVPGYEQLAADALQWYNRAAKLNPWDAEPRLGGGWCLDWLDRPSEAEAYFDQAEQLDPNSYYTTAFIGLHYLQNGNYVAARAWLERSDGLKRNITVDRAERIDTGLLLGIVNRDLMAAVTNAARAALYLPVPSGKR